MSDDQQIFDTYTTEHKRLDYLEHQAISVDVVLLELTGYFEHHKQEKFLDNQLRSKPLEEISGGVVFPVPGKRYLKEWELVNFALRLIMSSDRELERLEEDEEDKDAKARIKRIRYSNSGYSAIFARANSLFDILRLETANIGLGEHMRGGQ